MLFKILDFLALIINILYSFYLAKFKVWSWLLGIIGSILVLFLFTNKGIYSLVLLQVIYIIFFSFGWYKWHNQSNNEKHKSIKWMKFTDYFYYLIYMIFLCIFSIIFNYITSSTNIISTGILTGITFTAIIMTIEKFIENWIIWIISDLYFIVIMYQQELYGQMVQNFIFLITAIYGFNYWYITSNSNNR